MVNSITRHIGLPIAFAVLLALPLLACGKSGEKSAAKRASGIDASDPAIARIKSDVDSPIVFIIWDGGIPISVLDGSDPSISPLVGAGLVNPDYTLDNAKRDRVCTPTDSADARFSYTYVPSQDAVVGHILRSMEHAAFFRDGSVYRIDHPLAQHYIFWYNSGIQGCFDWYFFNLGHLSLVSATLVNAFDGPDRQTGATTKIRSYKVTAVFQPSAPVSSIAPNVSYGRFSWTVALERNPITAEWGPYQIGPLSWSP